MWGLYVNGTLRNTFDKQGDAWMYAIDNGLTEIRKGKSCFKKNVQLLHPDDNKRVQDAKSKANASS